MSPPQRTNFDFTLFANILNDINELDEECSLEAIRMLINLSYEIRDSRHEQNAAIRGDAKARIDLALIVTEVPDPEFVKCVAAACLALLYRTEGFSIEGVADHMTAADTRAEKPGDLTLVHHDQPVAAAEIKDKTRSLDWQDFQTALEICERFPSLQSYFFITESDRASRDDRVTEILSHFRHRFQGRTEIAVVTLQDLISLAAASTSYEEIVTLTATNVTLAPSIKVETREAWLRHATSRGVANG